MVGLDSLRGLAILGVILGSGANKGYIPKTNEDSYRNRSLRPHDTCPST